MPPQFLWTAAAITLVLLAGGAWSAYAVWVELRSVRRQLMRAVTALADVTPEQAKLTAEQAQLAATQRAMRQQLANLLSMLLRAGFKRGPVRDWSDDQAQTSVLGESTETKWDWRVPADG